MDLEMVYSRSSLYYISLPGVFCFPRSRSIFYFRVKYFPRETVPQPYVSRHWTGVKIRASLSFPITTTSRTLNPVAFTAQRTICITMQILSMKSVQLEGIVYSFIKQTLILFKIIITNINLIYYY